MEWISVKDRHPDPDKLDENGRYIAYLVYRSYDKTMHTAIWAKGRWELWTEAKPIYKISHWMPLPEPPKVGD